MIHAVILAGGWGRRFWPKSRRRLPKQLLNFGRKYSPLQNLFVQLKSEIPKERIWAVVNEAYASVLRRQLPSLAKKNIIVEPQSKNTASAIGLASVVIKKVDPAAITLVLSSDQTLGAKKLFLQAIRTASREAGQRDALVTIGIRPFRPAQEYGYIKIAQSSKNKAQSQNVYKVERFIEKPDTAKAKVYLKSKNYLWNSGIFAWKADAILKEIKRHLPQLYAGLQRIQKCWGLSNYAKQLKREYARFKNISIDYGVMEKTRNIYTLVGNFSLQDLGSWDNLSQGVFPRDRWGNTVGGLHKGLDTTNCVISSEGEHLVATLGVNDLIIAHTASATLVCKKDRIQDLKKLTELLEKDKHLKKYL